MDPFRLDGRAAVVTGSLGRLGPVWAGALLDAGANVLGLDRDGVPESDAWRALRGAHGDKRVVLLRADVRDRASLEEALAKCRGTFGIPHVLVNNAGIDQPPGSGGARHRVEDVPWDAMREVFEVNVLGAFQAAQVFGGAMAGAGRGSIVNVGSLYATVAPDPGLYDHLPGDPPFLKPPAYGASKSALANLTRYLAVLWGPRRVRVNTLSPGGVVGGQDPEFRAKFTARVPLGRMADLADLRGPLLFLASDASAYVTGHELRVDGGYVLR